MTNEQIFLSRLRSVSAGSKKELSLDDKKVDALNVAFKFIVDVLVCSNLKFNSTSTRRLLVDSRLKLLLDVVHAGGETSRSADQQDHQAKRYRVAVHRHRLSGGSGDGRRSSGIWSHLRRDTWRKIPLRLEAASTLRTEGRYDS